MTLRTRNAALVALLLLCSLVLAGCPSNMAAIDQSPLSEQDKVTLKVYETERSWTEAKRLTADTVQSLQASGVEIPKDVRDGILATVRTGDAAISQARIALAQGQNLAPGTALAAALRAIADATDRITGQAADLQGGQ